MRGEKGIGLCDFGANGSLDGGFDFAFGARGYTVMNSDSPSLAKGM